MDLVPTYRVIARVHNKDHKLHFGSVLMAICKSSTCNKMLMSETFRDFYTLSRYTVTHNCFEILVPCTYLLASKFMQL